MGILERILRAAIGGVLLSVSVPICIVAVPLLVVALIVAIGLLAICVVTFVVAFIGAVALVPKIAAIARPDSTKRKAGFSSIVTPN